MIRFTIKFFSTALLIFLVAMPVLILEVNAAKRGAPEIYSDLSVLPNRVKDMREAILEAARSGNIDALRPVLDSNELKPTISFGGADDPLKFWKQTSGDGQGREIMAILTEILEMDFARTSPGTSNEMYIWPYLAELPPGKLKPAQLVDLYRLMNHDEVKVMKEFGDYIHYRLGIGRDGTWHFFVAGD